MALFPPFSEELAFHYCQELINLINNNIVEIRHSPKVSEERDGHGIMIGAMVCTDCFENRIILQTVSGISQSLYFNNKTEYFVNGIKYIIVPPVVSEDDVYKSLCKNDYAIHELTDKINSKDFLSCIDELKEERKKLTTESLLAYFTEYVFHRFDGKIVTLNEIIKQKGVLPPVGTGDCCAPKLLDYAFSNNYKIISLCEVFFGKETDNRKNGNSYPPCTPRCGFILPFILGLDIVYRDKSIIVINKQSGLLSVPGRGEDKKDCVVSRLLSLFPHCISQPSVHRLDMETSGLMVLAFSVEAQRNLRISFEKGNVHKKYIALLDGNIKKHCGYSDKKNESGITKLKFRLDIDNRPHQIYDEENGKEGITEWRILNIENYKNALTGKRKVVSRMQFIPKTGRTHQLRLLSSDIHGFGLPIVGDSLYGNVEDGERLMLHSSELSFPHPISKKLMVFTSNPTF
jgi:tRNA pseudouridine32 synthase / 23S rRNA pseudouridine746 synthase